MSLDENKIRVVSVFSSHISYIICTYVWYYGSCISKLMWMLLVVTDFEAMKRKWKVCVCKETDDQLRARKRIVQLKVT
jgi:hypothetical protein